MTKKEIDLIRQFGMTISENASDEVQQQVLKGNENLKKSSRTEMSTWMQGVMERFDALLEEETRNRIMQDCGYNCSRVNKSTIERMAPHLVLRPPSSCISATGHLLERYDAGYSQLSDGGR